MTDISRRALIASSAWTVPAVTVARKAPMYATSDRTKTCTLHAFYNSAARHIRIHVEKCQLSPNAYISTVDGVKVKREGPGVYIHRVKRYSKTIKVVTVDPRTFKTEAHIIPVINPKRPNAHK